VESKKREGTPEPELIRRERLRNRPKGTADISPGRSPGNRTVARRSASWWDAWCWFRLIGNFTGAFTVRATASGGVNNSAQSFQVTVA